MNANNYVTAEKNQKSFTFVEVNDLKKKISHLFKYNTCADKKAKYFRINDKHDV